MKQFKALRSTGLMRCETAVALLVVCLLIFAVTHSAQAQSPTPQEMLEQYVSALRASPNDYSLREKIIKLTKQMKPEPAIPAQAERFGNRAEYIITNAKSDADLADAIKEYEKALLLSPWVSAYYYNLGAVCEKIGQLQQAINNYKLYLLAAPDAQDARAVRKQMDGLEYALEKSEITNKERKQRLKNSRVLIPAGEFTTADNPRKRVYLDAYYIDMYEVTVSQYKKFCEDTGRTMPAAPPWGWHDDQPMVNVSWEEANAYAQHYGMRLPTAAEWEKAARAGAQTRYCFGNGEQDLSDYAWYSINSGGQPHQVGARKPNALGLYDMHGNVEEWCSDLYSFINRDNNPGNPPTGQYPQLRGGSWNCSAARCALAGTITFIATGKGTVEAGFRCASSPEPLR